jgi:hypothetical protein
MEVDTADLTEVVRQVGELSRKVSCLTGRVTMMGRSLDAEGGPVQLSHVFRLGLELGERRADERGPQRPAPQAPRPRRDRHLRAIDGGGS